MRGIKPEQFFAMYRELMMQLHHKVDLVDLDVRPEFGKNPLHLTR